jgi:hypothetical protein
LSTGIPRRHEERKRRGDPVLSLEQNYNFLSAL